LQGIIKNYPPEGICDFGQLNTFEKTSTMRKIFFILTACLFITSMSSAQKVIADKKRKPNEPFALTIEGKDYKLYIKNYVLNHTNFKLWQKRCQDSCKANAATSEVVAKIKLLISFNHDGKVWVSDHYSSPNEFDYTDDELLAEWVNAIAKDLMKTIKKKGVVHPPFKNEMHYNDEIVLEYLWKYSCKGEK
jgi:hypothetical protein